LFFEPLIIIGNSPLLAWTPEVTSESSPTRESSYASLPTKFPAEFIQQGRKILLWLGLDVNSHATLGHLEFKLARFVEYSNNCSHKEAARTSRVRCVFVAAAGTSRKLEP
jgi:hypothetical protein